MEVPELSRVVASVSSGGMQVMGQLFVEGPTWDGDVVSKLGRDELVRQGIAFHTNGYTSLTELGVRLASRADVSSLRGDQTLNGRWSRKQRRG